MQNQLVCSGCGRVLRYQGGARNVFCDSCNTTTSVPAPGQDQPPPPSQGYSPPQEGPPQGYPPGGYPPGYLPRCYPFGPCASHYPGCGLGAMIGRCAARCGHHPPYGSHCWHGYCHGKFKHGC